MIRLVHSKPEGETLQQRAIRVMADCIIMRDTLTRAETRSIYKEIESARDALSKLLDRADGKNA